jgi:hypothetical protein
LRPAPRRLADLADAGEAARIEAFWPRIRGHALPSPGLAERGGAGTGNGALALVLEQAARWRAICR